MIPTRCKIGGHYVNSILAKTEATLSGLIADIGSDGLAEKTIPFRYKGLLNQQGMD